MELHPGDASYPAALIDCPDQPRTLWARGDLSLLTRPCVAIVGTRRATAYAERVTREMARTLARAGACVISGLARGVDAAAHFGALDVEGATTAVLGTGLDVVFPKGHASLQRKIGEKGLLLTELAPTNGAHGGSFPRRNRIIAGLASVTIVVEAGVKSGALITAGYALEMGRTVAAVPGPIDVPQSQGSNELLRDGAAAITSMADVLAVVGLTAPVRTRDLAVGGAERVIWDALAEGGTDLDTLCTRARLPAHEGLAAVSALELRGLVECGMTGEIRRM
ncbi:MAG: protecting protein DprA [Gemmatimonadetes bacterium]|nr:protecting protein DprA [Gemmatimonadota bacterium]